METIADIQQREQDDEYGINQKTGLAFKTPKRVRETKARWAKRNPDANKECIRKWRDNNRDRWNEICRNNHQKYKAELLYFRELFNEALTA